MNPIPKKKPVRFKRGSRALALLKASVTERDRYCRVCQRRFPLDPPHHIAYKSRGGEDTEENLILLCRICHSMVHRGDAWILAPHMFEAGYVSEYDVQRCCGDHCADHWWSIGYGYWFISRFSLEEIRGMVV